MYSTSRRSSCFIAGDCDAQSTTTSANTFSSSSSVISIPSPRLRSYLNLRSFNGRLYEPRFDYRQPHFLQTCALCKKSIGDHMDIFMYRGDTPFCSEECRQEQMDIDETSENKFKISSSSSSSSTVDKSLSDNKAQKYSIRASTVAAA